MCGICGIVSVKDGPSQEKAVRAMAATLIHRGPDDDGFFSDNRASIGMRRLSVIDLSTGRQPMSNEDGSVQAVFNGEIYNFKQIRSALEDKGHRFRTNSDTEVIPHLYEEFGEGFLKELNGMFGIAVWDSRARRLLLARDRLGVKPLYYAAFPDRLLFGSEAKAVLAAPGVSRETDLLGLNQYLTYEYVPPPRTIYKQMCKLAAGELLVFDTDTGRVRVSRYWDTPVDSLSGIREDDAVEQLRELISDAVRIRLESDVPLGVFLSGGVDSSAISAFAAQFSPHIKSFCIGFTEPAYDESAHARRAARAIGTDHHEDVLSITRALDLLPDMLDMLDEPMSDPSLLPTCLLSKFTRQHVTVALSGDGSDELFAGYPTYQAHRMFAFYRDAPRSVRAAVAAAAGILPVSTGNLPLGFKLRKFVSGAEYETIERQFTWLGPLPPHERAALLSPGFLNAVEGQDIFEPARSALGDVRTSWTDVEKAMFLDLRFYLAEDILTKIDRASMMHSLEARNPMLDYRIAEFACRLPLSLKLRGLKTKYILKKAVAPVVPKSVIHRKKQGFGIPLTLWIRKELRGAFEETLNETRLRADSLFNPAAVRALLDQHIAGRADNRKILWNLFIFHNWKDRWSS